MPTLTPALSHRMGEGESSAGRSELLSAFFAQQRFDNDKTFIACSRRTGEGQGEGAFTMLAPTPMTRAFQIHSADNVATLLDDANGAVQVLGSRPQEIQLLEKIARGHKVALSEIAPGDAVIKFGVRIGHATQPITRGAWVHLHNLASDLDERSSTLDLHSGAPTDTSSAYV